ncbi:MAG: hypothetical protein ACRDON_08725, partial [Gaiellaceae bacterium]
ALGAGGFPEIVSRAEASASREFGEGGSVHFFRASTLEFLSQKSSGFGLFWSGSILVLAALALLLVRPRNSLLLRREVWAMPVVALALFGLAHAFLFRLYLPHRYAYALVPFSAILVAVAWKPTWEELVERLGRARLISAAGLAATFALAVLALTVFPFGLRLSPHEALSTLADDTWYLVAALAVGLAAAVLLRRRSAALAASAVAAALLVGQVALAGGDGAPGFACKRLGLLRYLGTLPKEAVMAGNPTLLDCVPIVSRRAVVMNEKLFQPWEVDFWQMGRRRMFDSIRAYYGNSVRDIVALRERYGADYLVVERDFFWLGAWDGLEPFTSLVLELREEVPTPAVRRLPRECRTWRGRRDVVYDLACVKERAAGIRE